jgi:hypothetical protein
VSPGLLSAARIRRGDRSRRGGECEGDGRWPQAMPESSPSRRRSARGPTERSVRSDGGDPPRHTLAYAGPSGRDGVAGAGASLSSWLSHKWGGMREPRLRIDVCAGDPRGCRRSGSLLRLPRRLSGACGALRDHRPHKHRPERSGWLPVRTIDDAETIALTRDADMCQFSDRAVRNPCRLPSACRREDQPPPSACGRAGARRPPRTGAPVWRFPSLWERRASSVWGRRPSSLSGIRPACGRRLKVEPERPMLPV